MARDLVPFEAALDRVLSAAPRPRRTDVPLRRALGRVLARDLRADRDIPPFDRAALDGYAVCIDGPFGERQFLPVVGEIAAGDKGPREMRPGTAVRIWTGAAVPAGALGIVPVERAREEEGRVLLEGPVEPKNERRSGIADRGEDTRKGAVVLRKGTILGPGAMAVLGAIGAGTVPVQAEPEIAIVATGNELVTPEERATQVQIRSTNDLVAAAIAGAAGAARIRSLGIARDDPRELRASIRRGLAADILVVSGGISMGALDLVPDILRGLGVRVLLHRVAIRPGKPFLFGVSTGGRRTAVFGLPGNPVSVTVTALVLLGAFLRAWRAEARPEDRSIPVRTKNPIARGSDLLHFVPCTLRAGANGELWAREIPWNGSGDFLSASRADAFLRVPGDGRIRREGEILRADLMPGNRLLEDGHDA